MIFSNPFPLNEVFQELEQMQSYNKYFQKVSTKSVLKKEQMQFHKKVLLSATLMEIWSNLGLISQSLKLDGWIIFIDLATIMLVMVMMEMEDEVFLANAHRVKQHCQPKATTYYSTMNIIIHQKQQHILPPKSTWTRKNNSLWVPLAPNSSPPLHSRK